MRAPLASTTLNSCPQQQLNVMGAFPIKGIWRQPLPKTPVTAFNSIQCGHPPKWMLSTPVPWRDDERDFVQSRLN
jgi:hypothetical protein